MGKSIEMRLIFHRGDPPGRSYLGLLILALLGLAACAGGGNSATPLPAVRLPLAADRPTFVFFYTDN